MRRSRTGKRQSSFGIFLVILTLAIVVTASTVRANSLNDKSKALAQTEASLQQELETAQLKTTELETQEKYMLTKKYIEDQAKDKLGLVYKDEIVIKPNQD